MEVVLPAQGTPVPASVSASTALCDTLSPFKVQSSEWLYWFFSGLLYGEIMVSGEWITLFWTVFDFRDRRLNFFLGG